MNVNVRQVKVQTAATGSNWTAWASHVCKAMRVHNPNTVDVDIRRGTGGDEVTVPAGSVRTFWGVNDSAQLYARRTDQSGTQVYVQAEIIA